jgi:hypothetical protein
MVNWHAHHRDLAVFLPWKISAATAKGHREVEEGLCRLQQLLLQNKMWCKVQHLEDVTVDLIGRYGADSGCTNKIGIMSPYFECVVRAGA